MTSTTKILPCSFFQVRSFLSRLSPFGLTKNEKLMLLNHAPKSELEIHLLVEESEERLTDEQVRSISLEH